MADNRRQFSRIQFRADARLGLSEGDWSVEVIDLSLKGALVGTPEPVFAAIGSPCTLTVRLDEPGPAIRMEGTVVHRERGHFGIHCREMDLDSITHLRRLVELNLGDEALLQRELGRLSAS